MKYGEGPNSVMLYQIDFIDKIDAYRKIHPIKILSYEKTSTILVFTKCHTLMTDIKQILIQNFGVKKFEQPSKAKK